ASSNPCKAVKAKPRRPGPNPDVRFLDEPELEALLRAEGNDELGPVLGAMYLTAATTGLRQGERIGLRRRDVAWSAARSRGRRRVWRAEVAPVGPFRATR